MDDKCLWKSLWEWGYVICELALSVACHQAWVSWSELCCAIKQDTSLCGSLFCRMWLIIPADLTGPHAQLLELSWGVVKRCFVLYSSDIFPEQWVFLILLTLERVCIVFWGKWMSFSQKAIKIHRLFPLLSSSEPYEFVSLEWLQKWLDESTPTKPIDNHACLCSHDKLHPDKISIMKRISEYAADIFYSRYGGGPRLTGNSSCLLYLKRSAALSRHHDLFKRLSVFGAGLSCGCGSVTAPPVVSMIIWLKLCLDLISRVLCKKDLLPQV